MDVIPNRWSPRPRPTLPVVKPAPSAEAPPPPGQTLVPDAPDPPADPVVLPLTAGFLLLVAWLFTRRNRPIVGAQLPLRR